MRKKIVLFFLPALLLLANCADDVVTSETGSINEDSKEKTITLNVTMPGEPLPGEAIPGAEAKGTTRIALKDTETKVELAWEDNDQLYLVFAEEGEPKGKATVTVRDISEDGKTASFDIHIPAGVTAETFELYGVYGGTGFVGEESHEVAMPATPWSGSLKELQEKELVMLTFQNSGINRENPGNISIAFEHLGSLFNIAVENTGGTTISDVTGVELTASTDIFARQNSGSATYNVVNNTFSGTTTGTSLAFDLAVAADLVPGGVIDFWAWFPPSTGHWPSLDLKVKYGSSGELVTGDAQPARTADTEAGRVFVFYAEVGGVDSDALAFSTGLKRTFVDSRDNREYATVKIGEQTWLAENLKYLPEVSHRTDISGTEKRYYVFGYQGTDVEEARRETNYQNRGVLYNWLAAVDGCPEGWHLPTDPEWTQLALFVDPSFNPNGTGWNGTDGGAKLRSGTSGYGFVWMWGGYSMRQMTRLQMVLHLCIYGQQPSRLLIPNVLGDGS
jgi:uncharacterized protein (TIGR02145 family)